MVPVQCSTLNSICMTNQICQEGFFLMHNISNIWLESLLELSKAFQISARTSTPVFVGSLIPEVTCEHFRAVFKLLLCKCRPRVIFWLFEISPSAFSSMQTELFLQSGGTGAVFSSRCWGLYGNGRHFEDTVRYFFARTFASCRCQEITFPSHAKTSWNSYRAFSRVRCVPVMKKMAPCAFGVKATL